MRSLLGQLGRVWRATIGAAIPDSCRFTPSCSHYAAEALQRHGLIVGSLRTTWRLLRCQPLCRGGYDPVVRSRPACRATRTSRPG